MVDARQMLSNVKARLAKTFTSRNVQVAVLLVIAMIVVLLLVPAIPPSSVLYPWFVPLLELALVGLLVVIAIMNHLDATVQRVRDETGLERTGKLLPRRKKEGWFFSLDNVYNGVSLAYLALKAYIVLLAKDGYLSFSLEDLASELKMTNNKEELTTLLANACDEGLIVAVPGTSTYEITGSKGGDVNIKKVVKNRLPVKEPAPPPAQPSRPPIKVHRRR